MPRLGYKNTTTLHGATLTLAWTTKIQLRVSVQGGDPVRLPPDPDPVWPSPAAAEEATQLLGLAGDLGIVGGLLQHQPGWESWRWNEPTFFRAHAELGLMNVEPG